ncbi:MAG TPA: PHP domain-containing protein [Longimicrobiales bacterium]|nr:PHP domain-containing protein [Longimicrobiales bacterium]
MAKIRIDMHLHTARSFDCLSEPGRILEAAAARGVDRVCVTDHNEIAAAQRLKDQFGQQIIVGEEVKTAERVDVIGLYIHTLIPKGTPARETCQRIHEQGGIVYMPHPFGNGKGAGPRLLEELAELIDVVEVFNARLHRPELNQQARDWAVSHGKPGGAGSDAHTLAEVGRAFVEVEPFADTPAGFLRALRSAKVHGAAASRAVHLASTYAKLHKVVFKGKPA